MAESEFKIEVERGKSLNMEVEPKGDEKPGTSSKMAEKVAGKGVIPRRLLAYLQQKPIERLEDRDSGCGRAANGPVTRNHIKPRNGL
ncbi:hypothetical protein Ancab_013109 [Ancistrocladus abbreviatus]